MKFNYSYALKNKVLYQEGDNILLTTDNCNQIAVNEIKRQLITKISEPVNFKYVSDAKFQNIIESYFSTGKDNNLSSVVEATTTSLESLFDELENEVEDLLTSDNQAPIVKLINVVITDAVSKNVSDIHIEPFEDRLQIRFRIDGYLQLISSPSKAFGNMISTRIKVMANLDIAEKRLPQDGRIGIKIANRNIDLRVSTVPSNKGEKIVMRILDKSNQVFNLDTLNMSRDMVAKIRKIISKSHGIMLVTGPTGSGKTTTLYASISELNSMQNNIMTIEDPVEYNIDGINQTQVNSKANLTFAKGLRAILRQDPDIIMVGEIRDTETAKISITASLTGHLVVSTLHTNTSVGAITRLKDMGVEPFLLSSSILGIIAQRLVRRLCDNCKKQVRISQTNAETFNFDFETKVYEEIGCAECSNIGFKDRIGIFELMVIDDEIRHLINISSSEIEVLKYLKSKGHKGLLSNALHLVKTGKTTCNEIIRIMS